MCYRTVYVEVCIRLSCKSVHWGTEWHFQSDSSKHYASYILMNQLPINQSIERMNDSVLLISPLQSSDSGGHEPELMVGQPSNGKDAPSLMVLLYIDLLKDLPISSAR